MLAGIAGMVRRHQIRMRTAGPRRGEFEHFRAERGEHPVGDGYRVLGRIDRIQVRPRRGERLLVEAGFFGVDERGVAHADAEQKAFTMLGGQLGIRRRHVRGLMHPQVQDPGGDHDALGRPQQLAHRIEHGSADVGNPERGIPELLELGRGLGGLSGVAVAQLGTPYSDACQIHA